MLTAQDTSYDEARNLHSKWQKHQAFMAELASNKNWLHNIDKVNRKLTSMSVALVTPGIKIHFEHANKVQNIS